MWDTIFCNFVAESIFITITSYDYILSVWLVYVYIYCPHIYMTYGCCSSSTILSLHHLTAGWSAITTKKGHSTTSSTSRTTWSPPRSACSCYTQLPRASCTCTLRSLALRLNPPLLTEISRWGYFCESRLGSVESAPSRHLVITSRWVSCR